MTKTVCELDPRVKKLLYVCLCRYARVPMFLCSKFFYARARIFLCLKIFHDHVPMFPHTRACMFLLVSVCFYALCPYVSMLEHILCSCPDVSMLMFVCLNARALIFLRLNIIYACVPRLLCSYPYVSTFETFSMLLFLCFYARVNFEFKKFQKIYSQWISNCTYNVMNLMVETVCELIFK